MTEEEAHKEFDELLEIHTELLNLREEESRSRDNTEFDAEVEDTQIEYGNELQEKFVNRYKHYLEKFDQFKNKLADEDFSEHLSFGKDDFTKKFGIVEETETILLNESEEKISKRNVNFPEL